MNNMQYKEEVVFYWKNWQKTSYPVSGYFDAMMEVSAKKGEDFFEIPFIKGMEGLTNDDIKKYFKYVHNLECSIYVRFKPDEEKTLLEHLKSFFCIAILDGFFVSVKI